MHQIYLDHAATTKVSQSALHAMLPFYRDRFGNPSSHYQIGRREHQAILYAREQLASTIGAKPHEIIFTSGGTESDNWALTGLFDDYTYTERKRLLYSSIEHHAVMNTAKHMKKNRIEVEEIPVDYEGILRLDVLKRMLNRDVSLVSVMTVNNEIGTIQPIKKIADITHEQGALFHTDAVAAYGSYPINVKECDCDLLSVSSHKIYGPKGCGFLFVREGLKLSPLIYGGSQEGKMRAGTENVAQIVGFAQAAYDVCQQMEMRIKRVSELRDYFWCRLKNEIPNIKVNGSMKKRVCGNLNVVFRGVDAQTLLAMLDADGIYASAGSACNAGEMEASHVLTAIHLPEEEKKSSIRFTLGVENTMDEIDYVVRRLKQYVNQLRNLL